MTKASTCRLCYLWIYLLLRRVADLKIKALGSKRERASGGVCTCHSCRVVVEEVKVEAETSVVVENSAKYEVR